MTMAFDEQLIQALEWRHIGPHRGGRVVAVAGDPVEAQTFYFGACAGGVWKTTDGGTYWENVSDGQINVAADGGTTWQHCGLEDTRHIARVRIDPRNVMVEASARTRATSWSRRRSASAMPLARFSSARKRTAVLRVERVDLLGLQARAGVAQAGLDVVAGRRSAGRGDLPPRPRARRSRAPAAPR
jgi:hypothetical protein